MRMSELDVLRQRVSRYPVLLEGTNKPFADVPVGAVVLRPPLEELLEAPVRVEAHPSIGGQRVRRLREHQVADVRVLDLRDQTVEERCQEGIHAAALEREDTLVRGAQRDLLGLWSPALRLLLHAGSYGIADLDVGRVEVRPTRARRLPPLPVHEPKAQGVERTREVDRERTFRCSIKPKEGVTLRALQVEDDGLEGRLHEFRLNPERACDVAGHLGYETLPL